MMKRCLACNDGVHGQCVPPCDCCLDAAMNTKGDERMSDTVPRELLAAIIAAGLRAAAGGIPASKWISTQALADADAILERVRADEEGGE